MGLTHALSYKALRFLDGSSLCQAEEESDQKHLICKENIEA